MNKKVISSEFNIDTACVKVRFVDRSMIAIDCTLVEAEVVVICPRAENWDGWCIIRELTM